MFYNADWSGVNISEFIGILNDYLYWYNEKRIKKSLGYLSPIEYRHRLGLVTQIVQENVRTLLSFFPALPDCNLPYINLGQLQIILAAAGLLSVLATVSYMLFLSAKCKDTLTVLLISIVVLLMPLFAYVAMGATWLSTILPSAGIGMQNNFLSQLANFNYLNIGGMSFWTPHVILISAGIELFVFTFLAIHSYCRHQVA